MTFKEFMARYAQNADITARVQQGQTYAQIGDHYGITRENIRMRYRGFTVKLSQLYEQHLYKVLENKADLRTEFAQIAHFYWNGLYVIAYLEQKYESILNEFREGLPAQATVSPIPFRQLSEEAEKILTIKIIEEHEKHKKGFTQIGQETGLTREKANRLYELYYHAKVLAAIPVIEPHVDFSFFNYITKLNTSSRNKWEKVVNEYGHFLTEIETSSGV